MNRKHTQYQSKIIEDVTVSNKINGEVFIGNIINEKEIEGKNFWVFNLKDKPNRQLLLPKEYFTIKRSKS